MTDTKPELKACELLPCPFCGGEVKKRWMSESSKEFIGGLDSFYRISCNKCNVDMTMAYEGDIFRAWNARPSPIIPEDAATIAELREILGIKNKADESVIEHVKEILRVNRKMFAEWQKTFFEETDAKNAVQPVTDDALLAKAVEWIQCMWPQVSNRAPQDDEAMATLINHALKGQSK